MQALRQLGFNIGCCIVLGRDSKINNNYAPCPCPLALHSDVRLVAIRSIGKPLLVVFVEYIFVVLLNLLCYRWRAFKMVSYVCRQSRQKQVINLKNCPSKWIFIVTSEVYKWQYLNICIFLSTFDGQVKPSQLVDYLQQKKTEGYTIIGVEQTAKSFDLTEYCFPEKSLLLLG